MQLPELTASKAQREILDALPVLVFLERSGEIIYANREARHLLGVADRPWTPLPVEDVLWGLYPGTAEPQTTLLAPSQGSPFHATLPAPGGQLIPVEGTYSLLGAEGREAVVVAHPVSRSVQPRSQMMEDVLASLPEAVAIEHDEHVLYTNPAFTRLFGFTAEEIAGQSLRSLIVPETRWNELASLEKAVELQGVVNVETVRTTCSGELLDVSMQCAPLRVEGERVGYVFTFRDIAERKQAEERREFDSMHDSLTGLANRALFLDRLAQALSRRQRRPEQGCGVLFIDVDNFSRINHALGHAAGDALLVGVAERLKNQLRPHDSAARLSSDQFAVLVENIPHSGDLEIVVRRIAEAMEKPLDVFGHAVSATLSLGAVLAGATHAHPDMLLRDASYAMQRARETGPGKVAFFDQSQEPGFSEQQEREQQLRSALERHEFEFRYQPVYSLKTGQIEVLDTVLSLPRAGGQPEAATDGMEVAETTGLSVTLGEEALAAACQQLRLLAASESTRNCSVALHLTARQFFHPELVTQMKQALAAAALAPSRLILKITESALNERTEASVEVLKRLAETGVQLSIGNFGSSLAPLNHLVRFPVHRIRLDARLVEAAAHSERERGVVEALVRLAHGLGLTVGANGITDAQQLQVLIRLGCDLGQGSLLGAALPATAAAELASYRPADA